MGVFDKFQENIKNCQFLQNIYTWTANLGGSNFLVDIFIFEGTASAHNMTFNLTFEVFRCNIISKIPQQFWINSLNLRQLTNNMKGEAKLLLPNMKSQFWTTTRLSSTQFQEIRCLMQGHNLAPSIIALQETSLIAVTCCLMIPSQLCVKSLKMVLTGHRWWLKDFKRTRK